MQKSLVCCRLSWAFKPVIPIVDLTIFEVVALRDVHFIPDGIQIEKSDDGSPDQLSCKERKMEDSYIGDEGVDQCYVGQKTYSCRRIVLVSDYKACQVERTENASQQDVSVLLATVGENCGPIRAYDAVCDLEGNDQYKSDN